MEDMKDYCIISFTWTIQTGKFRERESRSFDAKGKGESDCLTGVGFPFGVLKSSWTRQRIVV